MGALLLRFNTWRGRLFWEDDVDKVKISPSLLRLSAEMPSCELEASRPHDVGGLSTGVLLLESVGVELAVLAD